jgi:hypothetical protein
MGAWFVKLMGGFLPWITKPFGEWAGKILFYAALITIGLVIYHNLTRPTSTTAQHADRDFTSVTNNNQPKATFGCATTKIFQYYRDRAIVNAEVVK